MLLAFNMKEKLFRLQSRLIAAPDESLDRVLDSKALEHDDRELVGALRQSMEAERERESGSPRSTVSFVTASGGTVSIRRRGERRSSSLGTEVFLQEVQQEVTRRSLTLTI